VTGAGLYGVERGGSSRPGDLHPSRHGDAHRHSLWPAGRAGRDIDDRSEHIASGFNLAKQYIRALVTRVTVGERKIRIEGSKAGLLKATANA